jgi:hypothetical protein
VEAIMRRVDRVARVILWLLLGSMLLAIAPPVIAQEFALARTPPAAALGPAWRIDLAVERPDATDRALGIGPTPFSSYAAVTYGGPNGTRALILVGLGPDDPVARQRSWEQGLTYLALYRERMAVTATSGNDAARDPDLAAQPPPAGCRQAARLQGDDLIVPFFPIAATLCATDPNVVVLALAMGEVDGRASVDAADALVALVITGTPAA